MATTYLQSNTETQLKNLCVEYMELAEITLSGIRTGKQVCSLPIGNENLRKLISGAAPISYKIQIKLLTFFGKKWEIKIIKR